MILFILLIEIVLVSFVKAVLEYYCIIQTTMRSVETVSCRNGSMRYSLMAS